MGSHSTRASAAPARGQPLASASLRSGAARVPAATAAATTSIVHLSSSPTPITRPRASHHAGWPPSIRCTHTSSASEPASTSNGTVWNQWAVATRRGQASVASAATSAAREDPPSSPAVSAATTITAPAAIAGTIRSRAGAVPSHRADAPASAGTPGGWST